MEDKYRKYPHYVPIVKWQKWERRALLETDATVAKRVLPCIEVRDSSQHTQMLSEYDSTWKGPGLVDYADPDGFLPTPRLAELIAFLSQGSGSSLQASPVLSPYAAPATLTSVKKVLAGRQMTLRVRIDDVETASSHLPALQKFMARPQAAGCVDRLLVDLGRTPTLTNTQIKSFASILTIFKAIGFEHVHLASGAFPNTLAHISGAGEVERLDWTLWTDIAAATPKLLLGFSDYGPLTPEWSEATLTRRGGRSAIRYALDDKWRVIRGASNQKSESIAISELMVQVYASEFKGKRYSFGDLLIDERADPLIFDSAKRCGHYHISEFWSHHIAFVVKDQY